MAITKSQEPCVSTSFNFFHFEIRLYLVLSLQFVNFGKRFNLGHFQGPSLLSPSWGFIKASWLMQPTTLEKAFWVSVFGDCTPGLWLLGNMGLEGRCLLVPSPCHQTLPWGPLLSPAIYSDRPLTWKISSLGVFPREARNLWEISGKISSIF